VDWRNKQVVGDLIYSVTQACSIDCRGLTMALSFLTSDLIQQASHQGQLMTLALVAVPSMLGVVASWPKALRVNPERGTADPQKPIDQKTGNTVLTEELSRRMNEISLLQNASFHALTELARLRDSESSNHLRRTEEYVRILATHLSRHSSHADQLDTATINLMAKSAPLHDIGKVGIPDRILLKPGSLSTDEWDIMKTHAILGEAVLQSVEKNAAEPLPFLIYAKQIARHHHEQWDGSGYPDRLCGESIPLSARLMAVADVFDALISKRVYKPSWSHQTALNTIVDGSGHHFDPIIVEALQACFDECVFVASHYSDSR
jgi:putative two-component system response regulator